MHGHSAAPLVYPEHTLRHFRALNQVGEVWKSFFLPSGQGLPDLPPPSHWPIPVPPSPAAPSQSSKWEVEIKSDNSPLTKADRVANQV